MKRQRNLLKEGRYTIDVALWHATLNQLSMGNGALVSPGVIVVGADGKMNLELTLQPLETSGLKGYLYNLKKVDMSTVEYNSVKYPVKYEAEDAEVLERFSGVYDDYNSPSSPSYDESTGGGEYPRKISIPIEMNEDMNYVEFISPSWSLSGKDKGHRWQGYIWTGTASKKRTMSWILKILLMVCTPSQGTW